MLLVFKLVKSTYKEEGNKLFSVRKEVVNGLKLHVDCFS